MSTRHLRREGDDVSKSSFHILKVHNLYSGAGYALECFPYDPQAGSGPILSKSPNI